jgi:ribosome maturation factor RimP
VGAPPAFLYAPNEEDTSDKDGVEANVSDAPKELWEVISAYLEAERIELDDLELLGGQSRKRLRATVDVPGGLDVDTLGELTAGISRILDEHDVIVGGYDLEVSSPGLERKLRRAEQFKKVIGKEITVKTRLEVDGQRRHDGVLISAADGNFEMNINGEARTVGYDQVLSARVVFVWPQTTMPGQKTQEDSA